MISDVGIPGNLNGIELGERIAADRPQIKIIYCTGYSAETLGSNKGIQEGHNFLAKPYDAQPAANPRLCLPKAASARPISIGLTQTPSHETQLIREMNAARARS